MARRVLVVGGGAAGCAAAVAAAEAGARVLLAEAAGHLGGVAVAACHREICGLAPIDASSPELLEPELAGPWAAAASTGAPLRRGRVWLWPTDAGRFADACRARCAAAGVEMRLRSPLDALAAHGDVLRARVAGRAVVADAVIDASGRGAAASLLGVPHAPPAQWGAQRCEIALPDDADARLRGRAGLIIALRAVAEATGLRGGCFIVPIGAGRWQFTLDLPRETPRAEASRLAGAAAAALGATVLCEAVAHGERDAGRPIGGTTLADLFAMRERGLCWAAWPREEHGADGVAWTWPPADRHGVPEAATRPSGAPPGLWCVGKAMPVDAAAAAALRVTGTCFALGAAVGRRAAQGAV